MNKSLLALFGACVLLSGCNFDQSTRVKENTTPDESVQEQTDTRVPRE